MTWVVAAPGPSLTVEVAEQLRGHRVIAVNDAWQRVPFADVLYAADEAWWRARGPKPHEFAGERWIEVDEHHAENQQYADEAGIKTINGIGGESLLCSKPGSIYWGHWPNSGQQAVALAINHFGARHVVMVGFDLRRVDNAAHFFGSYEHPFHDPVLPGMVNSFICAAATLPSSVRILNATPGSALTCFPMVRLEDALNGRLLRDSAEHHAAAG